VPGRAATACASTWASRNRRTLAPDIPPRAFLELGHNALLITLLINADAFGLFLIERAALPRGSSHRRYFTIAFSDSLARLRTGLHPARRPSQRHSKRASPGVTGGYPSGYVRTGAIQTYLERRNIQQWRDRCRRGYTPDPL
jgi:hypothetical protein